jgi:Domain of unknown function (DUF4249)
MAVSFNQSTLRRWQYGAGLALTCLIGLLSGCVDPYTPDAITAPQSYLVVDGFINMNGVTTIRLSRTRNLSSGAASPVEARANVVIQDEAGTQYPLTEQPAGTYTSAALTLSPAHQYQLRLRTANGRSYFSDLTAGKISPPIDTVTWEAGADGVQFYLNTHDATNATRYYRWSFQETWQFHSALRSELVYVNGQMEDRLEDIYWCWRTNTASPILLSTTNSLSQNVVSRFPLTHLSPTSEKLYFRYSLLVQQYAQTAEEFAYWDQLRKNTESLGTLFDPLPSQVSGNVHSLSDPDERVLGFVGATSVTEKRLFVSISELPDSFRPIDDYAACSNRPVEISLANTAATFRNSFLPLYGLYIPQSSILIGYAGAPADCVDCRLRGTNVKPSFWP